MTEEELKAVLQFKQIDLEDCSCEKCLYQEIESCRGCPTMIKETLLNLIEKQQEEIEHYKNKYEQEQMKQQDMINQIQQLEEEAREIELQKLEDYYNED